MKPRSRFLCASGRSICLVDNRLHAIATLLFSLGLFIDDDFVFTLSFIYSDAGIHSSVRGSFDWILIHRVLSFGGRIQCLGQLIHAGQCAFLDILSHDGIYFFQILFISHL